MRIITIIILTLLISCNSNKKRKPVGDSEFQRELNRFFKDASTSPLIKTDFKKFKGLPFFKTDNQYKVLAEFTKTSDPKVFHFPTTTERIVQYKKYGEINFKLKKQDFTLDIYKDNNFDSSELFLPFFDKTNNISTYAGGRFIDITTLDIKNDTIKIDFNKAYNPYCAYNKKYSCPITPNSNFLDIEIKAGVKIQKEKIISDTELE